MQGPCCHDALSAKLIEQAGFPFAFMSGFCTAAARLGAPDTGLISYAEMVDVGHTLHEATTALPIIGDGDTGYGNALNVKRTVRGYAAAGFAGALLLLHVLPHSANLREDEPLFTPVRGSAAAGFADALLLLHLLQSRALWTAGSRGQRVCVLVFYLHKPVRPLHLASRLDNAAVQAHTEHTLSCAACKELAVVAASERMHCVAAKQSALQPAACSCHPLRRTRL